MKPLYKPLLLILITLLTLLNAPIFAAQPRQQATSYLYIQRAKFAKLTQIKRPNTYQLVLRGVDPYVIYFSDRPKRKAGLIPVKKFYQLWSDKTLNGFNANPPNVGLAGVSLHEMLRGKDKTISHVFTLSKPSYTAHERAVTYVATIVGNTKNKLPKSMEFRYLVLFFDPYCPGCMLS